MLNSDQWPNARTPAAYRDPPPKPVMMSTEDVAALADPNVPLDRVDKEEHHYINSMIEGTGQFEGRGIREHGIQEPLKLRDGMLQEGHHRVVAARRLGIEHLPVIGR